MWGTVRGRGVSRQVARRLTNYLDVRGQRILLDETLAELYGVPTKAFNQEEWNPPLAFTEHGVIMAATILNSSRAIQMSVYVVRAFVRFRTLISTSKEITKELEAIERSVATLDVETRRQFDQVYEARS